MICTTSRPITPRTGRERSRFQLGELPAAARVIPRHGCSISRDLTPVWFSHRGGSLGPFVRGRHTPTNLNKQRFVDAELDSVTVGMLRDRLGLNAAIPKASITDIVLFIFCCVVVVLICDVLPLIGVVLLWSIAHKVL